MGNRGNTKEWKTKERWMDELDM